MKIFNNIGLEEVNEIETNRHEDDTVLPLETEIEIYGRITNFAGLDQAKSFEHHEQYEIKSEQSSTGNSGKIRVRKITLSDGANKYEITNKLKHPESNGINVNTEVTTETTLEHFMAFKAIATSSMEKTRYMFPVRNVKFRMTGENEKFITVPSITFEVDVFPGQHNDVTQWCKIDMELDSLIKEISNLPEKVDVFNMKINTANLPLGLQDTFIGHLATPEQKEVLDNLYQNIFTKKL